MKKVTFVVTIYNKEKYLERTLKGIKEQTGNFNKEYIFVDDCSTDNSLKMLKNLTKGWKNTVIHKMDKNGGVCQATRKGIELATGDYIKFIDGDDVLFPQTTGILFNAINDFDVPCATCRHGRLSKKGVMDRFYPERVITGMTQVYRKPYKQVIDGSCLFLANSMMLIKTSIAKDASVLLNTKYRRQQDYRLSLDIANKYDIAFCDFIGLYEWDTDGEKLSDYAQDVCFFYNATAIYDFMATMVINEYDEETSYIGATKILKLGMKKHYKFRKLYQFHKFLNPMIKFKNKDMSHKKLKKYINAYAKIVFNNNKKKGISN